MDRPYDAGIAVADQQVGRIVDFLDENKLRDQTLIVIVGDHGEGLGEHDEREHGHMLYNSTLRVPLIVAHPSLCQRGRRVTQAVSLVDLLPTFQECLGLKATPKLTGRSLKPALAGDFLVPRSCYAETDIPFLEHNWAPQRCLVTEDWKYIRSPRPEIYDLSRDPAELDNLADSQPERVREMEQLLADVESRMPARAARDANLSPAERRSLASLGYLACQAVNGHAGDGNDPTHQSLPDIKDRLRYHHRAIAF